MQKHLVEERSKRYEENIRKREKERDRKFAQTVGDRKSKETQHAQEIEARKAHMRQQQQEQMSKHQEEQELKKQQMQSRDAHRDTVIKQRAIERNKREQDRAQNVAGGNAAAGSPGSPTTAPAAPDAAS